MSLVLQDIIGTVRKIYRLEIEKSE